MKMAAAREWAVQWPAPDSWRDNNPGQYDRNLKAILHEEYFDAILSTLRNPALPSLKDSWKLLRVFEYNWDDLSDSQRIAT
jgi:hypothetical protein